jgi:hypothetical protein
VQGIKVMTLAGDRVSVDAAAVNELATGLQGDLLLPGMPDYDSARDLERGDRSSSLGHRPLCRH